MRRNGWLILFCGWLTRFIAPGLLSGGPIKISKLNCSAAMVMSEATSKDFIGKLMNVGSWVERCGKTLKQWHCGQYDEKKDLI